MCSFELLMMDGKPVWNMLDRSTEINKFWNDASCWLCSAKAKYCTYLTPPPEMYSHFLEANSSSHWHSVRQKSSEMHLSRIGRRSGESSNKTNRHSVSHRQPTQRPDDRHYSGRRLQIETVRHWDICDTHWLIKYRQCLTLWRLTTTIVVVPLR